MLCIVADLATDWRQLDERIEAVTDEIETLAKSDDSCRRVMTVPGIGPIISSAMVAAIGSGGAFARMTSGASATSSAANLRPRSALSSLERMSAWMLTPSVQPACWRAFWNAATPACPSRLLDAQYKSTPMRRICPNCCARAASGHIATLLISASRRLTGSPTAED